MRRYGPFLVMLAGVLLFAGCDNLSFLSPKPKSQAPKPPAGAVVAAKVGNYYITTDELNKEVETINNLAVQLKRPEEKIDTRDKKINYLRNVLVPRYLLFQEALDRGLDRNPDVVRALDAYKMGLLVTQLVSDEKQKIEVTDKDVEDFYNQNKDRLRDPEQRKVLEIVTPSEDDARQANIALLRGEDFGNVARQYSKAATASKGGDLGYITIDPDPKKWPKSQRFYEATFSPNLGEGEISNIFKGPDNNYYIVKIDGIKKSAVKPLSEVQTGLKEFLISDRQNKAISELSNKLQGETKIEINEGKVE